jgi:hypothetical protein
MTTVLNSGLVFKWLKSENTSSESSRKIANKIRKKIKLTHKQYRKMLAWGRKKTQVLERIMSENRWEDIDFSKIPSRAGLIYKNAFARHDIERMRAEKEVQSYADFAQDKTKTVNAEVLNPVDIACKIFGGQSLSQTDRLMLDKYWAGLKDYYHGRQENGIAVCDVSGSMCGQPLNAAVSMSAYIAERGRGPFANHFITFSERPQLVKFDGVDLCDKFQRASRASWGMNTNIEAVLDLLLDTAIRTKCSKEDMPTRIYVFSDMEFDACVTTGQVPSTTQYWGRSGNLITINRAQTLFEATKKKWAEFGYELPNIIFWNLDARHDNIPAIGEGFSYVSGFSMNMIECILSGKDGIDLMLEKLDSERYKDIH